MGGSCSTSSRRSSSAATRRATMHRATFASRPRFPRKSPSSGHECAWRRFTSRPRVEWRSRPRTACSAVRSRRREAASLPQRAAPGPNTPSPDDERRAESVVEQRPDTEPRAATGRDLPREESLVAAHADWSDCEPGSASPALEQVGLRARAGTDLAPQRRLAASPVELGERQHEREEGGLDHLACGEETARPTPDNRLVADQEVDQQVDARRLIHPSRRLREIARLQRWGDTAVAVRRIRLVPVLRQPDVLRAEVLAHALEQALEAGHGQPTGTRKRLQRRLGTPAAEPAWVRMM